MLKKFFTTSSTPVQILQQAQALKRNKEIYEAIALLEQANQQKKDSRLLHLLANFLLETGNYQRINQLDEIKAVDPRCYAIASRLMNANLKNPEQLCTDGHEPLENVAYVSMVKDEEDIVLYNLIWHYRLGLRKFFVIDNMSKDSTAQQIKLFGQMFADAQVFVLHDPVIAHYQGRKMTGASRFVMAMWPEIEWLVLVDADEMLSPTIPLNAVFADVPKAAEAIIVPKSVYYLVNGDATDNSDTFFNRIKYRKPLSYVSNKVIMRASSKVDISQGNHRIFYQDGTEVKNYWSHRSLSYREFPIRSFSQYKSKMVNGGEAIVAAKKQGFEDVGGGHWQAVYNLYLQQGEDGLRKKMQAIIANNSQIENIYDPFPMDKVLGSLSVKQKQLLASLL